MPRHRLNRSDRLAFRARVTEPTEARRMAFLDLSLLSSGSIVVLWRPGALRPGRPVI